MTRRAAAPAAPAATPVDLATIPDAVLDEALLLDRQLCFLVYRLHRALNDRYRPVLAGLGLTYPQYLAMLVLWEREPVTVGELGTRLDLDSGTLSPLLKRMEAGGLVTRSRSFADERAVVIALTEAGRSLRAQARGVPIAIGSCIANTPDEYVRVRTALADVLARVEGADAAPIG